MKRVHSRWRLAVESSAIVVLLVGAKLLAEHLHLEVIELNPLFTSIFAGGIFLFGLILAGTLADYKESERIPAEVVSASESILEEGLSLAQTKPEFDQKALRGRLLAIVAGLRADILDVDARHATAAVSELSASFLEMERLGMPANYVTRLKSEAALMRKALLRMYYIQHTGFLPSAYTLLESIVILLLGLLIFIRVEPVYNSLVVLAFLTYLFTYILKLLKLLDRPFQPEHTTTDDVSLFLLHEFERKLQGQDSGEETESQGRR